MRKEKDYRYAREEYIYYSLPATIFVIILIVIPLLLSADIKTGIEAYFSDWESLILTSSALSFALFFTVYSLYYRKKRSKILNSKLFYEGKIVKCDAVYRTKGIGTRYYLYIEFEKNEEKESMVTSGYSKDPKEILGSLKCRVFELNGKYYPAYFTLETKKQTKIDIPSYNSIGTLETKKKKEAEKDRRKLKSKMW